MVQQSWLAYDTRSFSFVVYASRRAARDGARMSEGAIRFAERGNRAVHADRMPAERLTYSYISRFSRDERQQAMAAEAIEAMDDEGEEYDGAYYYALLYWEGADVEDAARLGFIRYKQAAV